MTRAVSVGRWLALAAIAALTAAGTNIEANALHNRLTLGNIQRVLDADEVERFTGGSPVQHAILDLQAAAFFIGDVDLLGVDEWLGLEFAEGFDSDNNATSNTVTVAIFDLADVATANTRFDEVRDQAFLVESEQGIGDRFAGLSPQIVGLHTLVLFRERDKVVLMTTSTTEDRPEPLVSSEALVDLSRIVARRLQR